MQNGFHLLCGEKLAQLTLKINCKNMKTTLALLLSILALSAFSADPQEAKAKGWYTDQFLTASTTDFSHDDAYGFGLGVGYQVTKVFAADVRLTHDGLHLENNGVSTIGGRVLARLPFKALSPYGFLGASFDLRSDSWRLQPGIGAEIGVSKRLRGLSIFGEAGLDADLRGQNSFLFGAGLRWRF